MDISIIVPAYNVSKYIEKCIDSLLNQTFTGQYEIIIVNDGSTDNTLEIVEEYKDNEKIVLINQSNMGLSDARNTGIKHSKGKFLFFIDADDFVSRTLLEDASRNINDSDLVIFGLTKQLEDGNVIYVDHPKKNKIINENMFWDSFCIDHPIICTTSCTKMYKRSIFDTISFPSHKVHEDVYTLHSIIEHCNKISLLSKSLYFYVKRDGSITNVVKDQNILDLFDAYFSRIDYFANKKNQKNLNRTLLSILSQYRYYHTKKIISEELDGIINQKIREKIKELRDQRMKMPKYCLYFSSNLKKCLEIVLMKSRFNKFYYSFRIKRT